MFTRRRHCAIRLPAHHAPDRAHRLAYAHKLALNEDLLADRHRPEICHIQRTAHTQVPPEIGRVDQAYGQRGAEVEESGGAASVQVAHRVRVFWLNGVAEDALGVFGVVQRP